MIGNPSRRVPLPATVVALSLSALLAGCMGAPTYGTDTPADQQLIQDISGILSPGGPDADDPEIAYTPRPELVRPASMAVLPTPQDSVTAGEAWPESPEERLARIRAEATEHRDDPTYRSPVVGTAEGTGRVAVAELPGAGGTGSSPRSAESGLGGQTDAAQREEFKRRLASRTQGSPTERRYLSEPPLDYRVPASTAPSGDVGVDEWRKERQARRAAGEKGGWRDYVPWL